MKTYNTIAQESFYKFLQQDENLGSSKYNHITTGNIVKALENDGWKICALSVQGKQTKTFDKQFHIVRMRNKNFKIDSNNYFEILIGNSYDCSKSAFLQVGIFRTLCANGLVVGDTFYKKTFKHVGINKEEQMMQEVQKLREIMPILSDKIKKLQNTALSPKQKFKFAYRCLRLRGFNDNNVIDFRDYLKPLRDADKQNNAYNVLNIVQEKLLRTGIKCLQGKKIIPIKDVKKVNKLNRQIFDTMAA